MTGPYDIRTECVHQMTNQYRYLLFHVEKERKQNAVICY